MPAQPFVRRRWWLLAAGGAALAAGGMRVGWAQAPRTVRYRATIDAVDAKSISVTTREGQSLTLGVDSDTVVLAVVPMTLEDIRPGSYIGAAAMPRPDGTQRALEVHIFPESMRGTGEGHGPFDLQPLSTMTTGTVASVTGGARRTLTVKYQDGEKTVVVLPDTPVVALEPGSLALLVPGAHCIVTAIEATEGQLSATRILVGKDGLVPPM